MEVLFEKLSVNDPMNNILLLVMTVFGGVWLYQLPTGTLCISCLIEITWSNNVDLLKLIIIWKQKENIFSLCCFWKRYGSTL